MMRRISSWTKHTGLRKPSTLGIEGGYPRMTRGEGVETCSTVKTRPEDLHVRGAAKKSKRCWIIGRSALRRERSKRHQHRSLRYSKRSPCFGTCCTGLSSVRLIALMSCISRRMFVRVFLALCSTCRRGPKMGRKQDTTRYIWISGQSFMEDDRMMMSRRMVSAKREKG